MRDRHVLSELVTQVVITSAKPASLPPMVMDTSEVEEFSEPSWLASTSSVFAPEQALKANEEGLWAAFHR
ncbi:hypothetical protein SCANM63S_08338 [Streptomyces canarius]